MRWPISRRSNCEKLAKTPVPNSSLEASTDHTATGYDHASQGYHAFQFAQYEMDEVAGGICVGKAGCYGNYHWEPQDWTGGLTTADNPNNGPTQSYTPPAVQGPIYYLTSSSGTPNRHSGEEHVFSAGLQIFGFNLSSEAMYSSATEESWGRTGEGCPTSSGDEDELWGNSGQGGWASAPIAENDCYAPVK